MKLLTCSNCGSHDLYENNGYQICRYCHSRYILETNHLHSPSIYSNPSQTVASGISLNDDIQRLLQKCKMEPHKAARYASLILDIDPTNKEALKYL